LTTSERRSPVVERFERWLEDHHRAALLAAAVSAVLLRLGYATVGVSAKLSDDAAHFWAIAGNVVDGRGYSYLGQPTAWRPPLYTYLLAALRAMGLGVRGVQDAQALASVATVALLWLCARRLGLARWAAVLAAWAGAVYPPLIHFSSQVWSENASVPTLLLAVYASLVVLGRRTWLSGALAGAAWGLAILARPSALPAVACLLVVLVRAGPRRAAAGPRRAAASTLVAVAVVVAPWLAWDAANVGGIVPVVSNESFTLWVSNRLDARGIKDVFRDPRYSGLQDYGVHGRAFPGIEATAAAHHFAFDLASEAARDRWFRTLVSHDVAADVPRFLWRAVEKTAAALNPAPDNASQVQRTSTAAKVVLWLSSGPLLVAGWIGVGLGMGGRHRSPAWVFVGLAALVSLVGLAVHLPYVRYRVGAVDPLLILGAALLASSARSHRRSPAM
jgi:hypothetical protein